MTDHRAHEEEGVDVGEASLSRTLFIISFALGITIGAFNAEATVLHPALILIMSVGACWYAVSSYREARAPVVEPEAEIEVEAETDLDVEVDPEVEVEAVVEPETVAEAAVEVEPETVAEAAVEAEPETVVEAAVEAEPETVVEVEAEPETEVETEAGVMDMPRQEWSQPRTWSDFVLRAPTDKEIGLATPVGVATDLKETQGSAEEASEEDPPAKPQRKGKRKRRAPNRGVQLTLGL